MQNVHKKMKKNKTEISTLFISYYKRENGEKFNLIVDSFVVRPKINMEKSHEINK